jgi:hypothetical protein
MKNTNYNLLKLLHLALDNVWRIEKHYLKDAKGKCSRCLDLLEKIKTDTQKHIELLKEELSKHLEKDNLS